MPLLLAASREYHISLSVFAQNVSWSIFVAVMDFLKERPCFRRVSGFVSTRSAAACEIASVMIMIVVFVAMTYTLADERTDSFPIQAR